MSVSGSGASQLRTGVYVWAIVGVLALLVQALVRLAPIALEALQSGALSPLLSATCLGWVLMNLYLEGYRGFQLRFVPRVIARAQHLATRPDASPLTLLFAPLFVMAFFGARRRAVIAAWALTFVIVLAVILVRALPSPYRGIVDAGVVAGLGYGAMNLAYAASLQLISPRPTADPELPT